MKELIVQHLFKFIINIIINFFPEIQLIKLKKKILKIKKILKRVILFFGKVMLQYVLIPKNLIHAYGPRKKSSNNANTKNNKKN